MLYCIEFSHRLFQCKYTTIFIIGGNNDVFFNKIGGNNMCCFNKNGGNKQKKPAKTISATTQPTTSALPFSMYRYRTL